jgi:hypothetical protein
MAKYKVTSSFAMFRGDEEVSAADMLVVCADIDAATRVFLSEIKILTGKARSALNYTELVASAFVFRTDDSGNEQRTVHNYTVELRSEDEDEPLV